MARRRVPDASTIDEIREQIRLQLKEAATTGLLNTKRSDAIYEAFKKRWRRASVDCDVLLPETDRLEPHVNWLDGPFDVEDRFIKAARRGNRLAIEVLDEVIVKRLAEGLMPSPKLACYAADVLQHGKPKLNQGPISLTQRDQVIIWTLEWVQIAGLDPTRNDATDTVEIPPEVFDRERGTEQAWDQPQPPYDRGHLDEEEKALRSVRLDFSEELAFRLTSHVTASFLQIGLVRKEIRACRNDF